MLVALCRGFWCCFGWFFFSLDFRFSGRGFGRGFLCFCCCWGYLSLCLFGALLFVDDRSFGGFHDFLINKQVVHGVRHLRTLGQPVLHALSIL